MAGETDLLKLLKRLDPQLNAGEFVFATMSTDEADRVKRSDVLGEFKEEEGTTLILKRDVANQYDLSYENVYAWITLKVHSSLEAVGLTAAFATELAEHSISCNVMAGYYHDHIFVNVKDSERAVQVLNCLSESH